MAIPNNFRSALHGFNREDVVQYLEYINNKHQNLMNQLNEELAKLRERPEGVPEEELTAARERCGELEQQLSELSEQLTQSQQRENDLNQQLELAQLRENDLLQQLEQAQQRENSLSGQSNQFQKRENDLIDQLDQAHQRESDLIMQLNQAQLRESDLAKQVEQAQQREAALTQQLNQEKSSRTAQTVSQDSRDDLEIFRLSARSERSAREQSELVYHQANGVLNEATARVTAISDDLTAAADRAMAQITQLQMAVSKSKQALQDAASIMQAIKPNRS